MDKTAFVHEQLEERKMSEVIVYQEELKQSEDPVKSPVIQEIIMINRIGAISVELAKRLNIAPEKALQLFYESQICADLHDKSTGLYLYGDLYVAEVGMRMRKRGMGDETNNVYLCKGI